MMTKNTQKIRFATVHYLTSSKTSSDKYLVIASKDFVQNRDELLFYAVKDGKVTKVFNVSPESLVNFLVIDDLLQD